MPSSTFATDPEPPVSRARRRRRQRRRNDVATPEGSNGTECVTDSVEDNLSLEDHSEHVTQTETNMNLGGKSSFPVRRCKIFVN